MKKFMDENFLLENDTAVDLYHNFAKTMPIIDYHCHLNPKEIYENKKFKNITEVWLYGDHYKWRLMRSNGIEENSITGDVSDYDKFYAFAKTIPMSIGNPMYHWVHLELQRFFGIYDLLNEKNADKIWNKANELLNGEGFRVRDLINKSNVKVICTTDDPTDTLEYHKLIKEDKEFKVEVLPTFRPDKGVEIQKQTFLPWIEKMGEIYGQPVNSYKVLLDALENRVNYFHEMGCRISDHALDYVPYSNASLDEAEKIFEKALKGEKISLEEADQYKTYTLKFLGNLYVEHDWTMQLHMNAMRNNNTKMFQKMGPDTGFDSINDSGIAYPLSRLLDMLEMQSSLPKTILYSLNKIDNDVIGTMLGNFQGSNAEGKIQFGAAWWFNDTRDGMIDQMKSLANLGLLSRFVGMLTDSRSFLSYTRHEYFRRILCNLIGKWVENGEFPNDRDLLGHIVTGICYNNAKKYFKF